MSDSLLLAIQISILGMGLVFAAIFLLWGVIALLVRLTSKPTKQEARFSAEEAERKRRAAVAAITVALAQELDTQPHEFPLPPTALVSAWQAVMRGNILKRRGSAR
jgi:Na+-transporting methylmalonyl-CoA/oxaloacetate decarboxylase gamma subunit